MTEAKLVPHIRRMASLASEIQADAEYLGQNPDARSDSAYLLELLTFEIVLKALVHAHGGAPPPKHDYVEIFQLLPPDVRKRVVAAAQERMTTGADYSDMPKLLTTFGYNFVALRYPYDAYRAMSTEEYTAVGKTWAEKGAPLNEAVFVYYSEELYGLTIALQQEVQHWLAVAEAPT